MYDLEHKKRRYFEKCLSVFVYTMEANDNQNCLATNILQNIFYCFPQQKESHAGLEWHEGE